MENCNNPKGARYEIFFTVLTFGINLIIKAVQKAQEKKREREKSNQ